MEENSISNELVLNDAARNHLITVRIWVYAISIVGLTGVLLLFFISIYGYISLSSWNDVPTGGGVGFLFGMIAVYFSVFLSASWLLPFYYLNKFSSYLKMALDVDDSELLGISFRYLKLHYKAIGILLLVYIAIYIVLRISF